MTPPDISQETVRQFLAMLVVTKTSIESKLDLFQTLTKWYLCLN